MRQFARSLLLCLAVSPVLSVHAEPVQGLYRVVEPVAEGQAREESLRRAFDTLLLRLTGRADLAQSEALAALRQDPQQLVRQFGQQAGKTVVEFDPSSVLRQLQAAGISTWGADRPAILAWWLIDTPAEAQLVGDGQPRAESLRAAAQQFGLPLVVPLGDLSEQLAVNREVLQQPAQLAEPSARYNADALLAVLAREDEGRWHAEWHLQLADAQTKGQVSADSMEALAGAVMQGAQAWLAPKFISRPGRAEAVLLEIENVDISRFAETERLLQPLRGQLVEVTGNRLTYRLQVDPAQLRSQLGLSSLAEVPVEPEPAAQSAQSLNAAAAPQPPVAAAAAPADKTLRLRYRW